MHRKKIMEFGMGLQRMLMQVMLVGEIIAAMAATAPPQAKQGCQDRCGDVFIPYPFGIGTGCYYGEEFNITCTETSSGFKPFYGNINVTDISLEGQLHVLLFTATACNEKSGNNPWFATSKFTISSTQNKFTVVGCDTYGTIQGYKDGKSYATGCTTMCESIDYVANGTCSGIGCCQTSIPKGVRYSDVTVSSFNNHTKVSNFSPCSFAFVVEEAKFNFSSSNLTDLQNVKQLPAVLDWTIGNETCEVAQKHLTAYACKDNSECVDADYDLGYRCNCSLGFEGNPYHPNGCQDIDECKDPSLNECKRVCVNTFGSYNCSCPKWHQGDGRKGGEGCTPDHVLVIQIVAGLAISITAVLVCSFWLHWRLGVKKLVKLKEKFFEQNGGLVLRRLSRPEGSTETIKIFTSEELKKATDNYDQSRIIGRGGFGTVYKGNLVDNRTVAIKKSKIVDQSQIEQFINEAIVLSQINHRNVVKLLGCCLETEVPLLVYELITNGTLCDHIHDESKASDISWEARLRIAAETNGVSSYLHSSASMPIIHRDVKSTNILLDDNFTAKVSDFGASRLVPLDQMQLSTMVQGTLGYLDPEYLRTSQLTEKSDVYSFGVVLVELLTGRKALCLNRPEEEKNLAMYFLSSLKQDRLFQVLEHCIVNDGNTTQLKEVANVAKRCLQAEGEERPTMKEVAMELEGLRMMQRHPWAKDELNSEETEYLLGEAHGFGGSTMTTANCDSTRVHTLLPLELDGGR